MSFDKNRNAPDRIALPPIEASEICNRVTNSEGFATGWGNSGITVTAGQTDSLGTTRAVKLARTGAKYVLGDGAGGPGVYPSWSISDGELIAAAIDLTGSPINGSIWIEAKAGSARQLLVFLYDGTYGAVFPSTAITLSDDWQWYRIPYSYNTTRGALELCLSPGGFDPEISDCYVRAAQIDDGKSNSYTKTSGSVVLPDATSATVLERKATFSGGADLGSQKITSLATPSAGTDAATKAYVDSVAGGEVPAARTLTAGTEMTGGGDLSANRTFNVTTTQAAAASTIPKLDASSRIAVKGLIASGTAPTISNVSATIGTGGTVTLDTGSNDQAGTIIINTGTGSPQYYVTFRLSWSTTLPGNAPVVILTLSDGASAWGSGNAHFAGAAHVIADGSPNSQISVFANNEFGSGGVFTDLNFTASSTYKINYMVALK